MPNKSWIKNKDFVNTVRISLENCNDFSWLATHSPLAAPYFLGCSLDGQVATDKTTYFGKALRTELKNAARLLTQEQRSLLDAAFFERKSGATDLAVATSLSISESTYYRHRSRATAELAEKLAQNLVPPLRSEVPIDQTMIGRERMHHQCLSLLRGGFSGYIHGVSGVGKTTLGMKIATAWNDLQITENEALQSHESCTFWYTIRPSFNDYISSFVFALGFFFRQHTGRHTWQQLVADKGEVNLERIISLIRYDLENVNDRRLLICIDDADLLEAENLKHAPILHLIRELFSLAPVLLMGQRVIVQTKQTYEVSGLEGEEFATYLQHLGFADLTDSTLEILQLRTKGNPTLLSLLHTLTKLNDNLKACLKALEDAPSVEPLYIRILGWLSQEERDILIQLMVFRNPSPEDAWTQENKIIDKLMEYGLVGRDCQGGIVVLPHIRNIGYTRASVEKKILFHKRAAKIREERADVVAAMYHYIAANQPLPAIWLWYTNRKLEMEHGRGASALELLRYISSTELSDERDRNALLISRSELSKSLGELENAATDLDCISILKKDRVSGYVQELQAEIVDMQGRAEQAIEKYRSALSAYVSEPSAKEVQIRTRIGFLSEFGLQNRSEALQEALLARIRAESFHGNIEEVAGNYQMARERYHAAYHIAQQLDIKHSAILSKVHSQLGSLTLREGEVDTSIELSEKAIKYDEDRGDLIFPLYDMLNLAYAYTLAQNYDMSYKVSCKGLETAEKIKSPFLIAGLACGAGEACVGMGRFDEAEQYGHYSLEQEEGYFRCWGLALLGVVSTKQGKYEQAKKQLREAINNASEDKYGEAHCWHMLGNLYNRLGRIAETQNAYETSLSIYKDLALQYKVFEIENEIRELIVTPVLESR